MKTSKDSRMDFTFRAFPFLTGLSREMFSGSLPMLASCGVFAHFLPVFAVKWSFSSLTSSTIAADPHPSSFSNTVPATTTFNNPPWSSSPTSNNLPWTGLPLPRPTTFPALPLPRPTTFPALLLPICCKLSSAFRQSWHNHTMCSCLGNADWRFRTVREVGQTDLLLETIQMNLYISHFSIFKGSVVGEVVSW